MVFLYVDAGEKRAMEMYLSKLSKLLCHFGAEHGAKGASNVFCEKLVRAESNINTT